MEHHTHTHTHTHTFIYIYIYIYIYMYIYIYIYILTNEIMFQLLGYLWNATEDRNYQHYNLILYPYYIYALISECFVIWHFALLIWWRGNEIIIKYLKFKKLVMKTVMIGDWNSIRKSNWVEHVVGFEENWPETTALISPIDWKCKHFNLLLLTMYS